MEYTIQNQLKVLLGENLQNMNSASLRMTKIRFIPDKQRKKKELDEVCKCANENRNLPAYTFNVTGMKSFQMRLAARMMINQSGSTRDLTILLHRNYSCPMIPGSALKGIARSWANENTKDNEEKRAVFARVFGGEEKGKSDNKGTVCFMAAYPVDNGWKMVVDVLTSHGGSDTKNPNPVFFPAVEAGAKFRFIVVPTSRAQNGDLDFAVDALKKALREHGVGAKTAAGYGWFEIRG